MIMEILRQYDHSRVWCIRYNTWLMSWPEGRIVFHLTMVSLFSSFPSRHGTFTFHSWWRHQMETFSALLTLTGDRWIPRTMASDAELWVFFDLRLNKRLNKQSRRRWFETPSHTLWRDCNVVSYTLLYISCFITVFCCLIAHAANIYCL